MKDHLIFVAKINELPDNKPLCLVVNGAPLALGKSKGQYYAVANQCTHAASSFEEGKLKAHFIVCPLHGVMFDMRSGEPRGNLAKEPLKTYRLEVKNGDELWVDLG